MYSRPPLLGGVTVTTSAVINTSVVTTILVAPGATSAYRLQGIHMASVPAQTGNIRAQIQDSLAGAIAHMAFQPGASDDLFWPFPGFQLLANAALTVSQSSNVASQSLRLTVFYYIDDVS